MDFSYCELITEVPNMSQCQSLRTLSLNGCRNLIKVHDSVGFLSSLVNLNVASCAKLTCFPHEINLPSLQEIHFARCTSLHYFPHIVGKMESLAFIGAGGSAIKELPPSVSIGNLPNFEALDLEACNSLGEFPSNLFTFPNLRYLNLDGTQPLSGKSFSQLMLENQAVISCTNLQSLHLGYCGLLDEDLHLILKCLLNLELLFLLGSDIESLPECIKVCAKLMTLEVSNCKRLRDIPELPPMLLYIRAENCTSLTKESLDRLWSYQAVYILQSRLHEFEQDRYKRLLRLHIRMPAATTFPDWLDHCCKGGKLSFRAREKFPAFTLAVEVGKDDTSRRLNFDVSMSINGCKIQMDRHLRHFATTEGHVLLFGLEMIDYIRLEGGSVFDKFLEMGWNDVEIEFTSFYPPDMSIVNCGLCVNKLLTNMENIQFKSSLKRRAMASPSNEPPKKLLRKFRAPGKAKLSKTERRKED